MQPGKPIKLYEWIQNRFTSEGRSEFVELVGQHLRSIVRPGDRVLDLCCGAGPISFLMESFGAEVTGIDIAPAMIELARRAAEIRASNVSFILGDVLTSDFGSDPYDLVVFLGNTLSDFSEKQFARLVERVRDTLKMGGRFALHYIDGARYYAEQVENQSGLDQEEPFRITWRFKEYLLEEAAFVVTYRNEETGEEYDYTSYIYTIPSVWAELRPWFTPAHRIHLGERSVMDVYQRTV